MAANDEIMVRSLIAVRTSILRSDPNTIVLQTTDSQDDTRYFTLSLADFVELATQLYERRRSSEFPKHHARGAVKADHDSRCEAAMPRAVPKRSDGLLTAGMAAIPTDGDYQ